VRECRCPKLPACRGSGGLLPHSRVSIHLTLYLVETLRARLEDFLVSASKIFETEQQVRGSMGCVQTLAMTLGKGKIRNASAE
jgi:hypothetical protein